MKRILILFAVLFYVTVATNSNAQTFSYRELNGTDGGNPVAAQVEGLNGNLYGTTDSGGTGDGGTIYELTPAGKLTTLYNFCSQAGCADGKYPQGIILAANGNFLRVNGRRGNQQQCQLQQ